MRRPLGDKFLEAFAGFGSCALAAEVPAAVTIDLADDDPGTRKLLRRHCSQQPGVYGMIDARGELIYVGKSKSLRNRLLSYFHASAADSKARKIIERTERLTWEPAPHEFAALLRELELIRRWEPRFNVQLRPRRRSWAYVCLGRPPAAHAFLAARPPARAARCFGPLPARRRLRDALRTFNHLFRLRDCAENVPILFAEQQELFSQDRTPQCLRHALGTCLAPCAGICSRGQYDHQVRLARAFLRGDRSQLDQLELSMRAAAAEQQFERAAGLRDIWSELNWLADQLDRLQHARRHYSFIYPLPDYAGNEAWYLFQGGQLREVTPAPRGRRSARRTSKRLQHVYDTAQTAAAHHQSEDWELLQLTITWFRRNPAELERTISPAAALDVCHRALQ